MRSSHAGFTLMEILIAMGVLLVGLAGILALFPTGLNAARQAMEDTNSALIAESVYAALRASAQRTATYDGSAGSGKMVFFFDGINTSTQSVYPLKSTSFFRKNPDMQGKTFGIPSFHVGPSGSASDGTPVDIFSGTTPNYNALPSDYCRLGQARPSTGTTNFPFNVMRGSDGTIATDQANVERDQSQLAQYSFNIQILCPASNPTSLYDVVIRINRNDRLVKKFYTQIMIPTSEN